MRRHASNDIPSLICPSCYRQYTQRRVVPTASLHPRNNSVRHHVSLKDCRYHCGCGLPAPGLPAPGQVRGGRQALGAGRRAQEVRGKSQALAPHPHPCTHTQACYPTLQKDKRKLRFAHSHSEARAIDRQGVPRGPKGGRGAQKEPSWPPVGPIEGDPEVTRDFFSKYEAGAYDRMVLDKLRRVFEEAGQTHLLQEYEAVSRTGHFPIAFLV